MATILLATYRYREERHLAIWYVRGSKVWKDALDRYFSYVFFHQLIRVLNFLFLVNTNWLQLLIGIFLNTSINYYMYKNDWVPKDITKVELRAGTRGCAFDRRGQFSSIVRFSVLTLMSVLSEFVDRESHKLST